MISPTGVQAVHPDGEVAVARAAAARGIAMGLSSFASKPIEDVVAANPQTFFQMYWVGTREEMLARMERARRAGAVGMIATLDWSFSYGRDWGSPFIPEKINFEAMRKYAPQVLMRPRWLLRLRQDRQDPRPHRAQHGRRPRRAGADLLRRLRQVDAVAAAHLGRRRLAARAVGRARSCSRASCASTTPSAPSTPASPPSRCPTTAATTSTARRPRSGRCPPSPRPSATRSRCCSTAASAAAATSSRPSPSGAKAVMIGRAYLWGLAANGQAGVENVLDLLRDGLDSAMVGLGHAIGRPTSAATTSSSRTASNAIWAAPPSPTPCSPPHPPAPAARPDPRQWVGHRSVPHPLRARVRSTACRRRRTGARR